MRGNLKIIKNAGGGVIYPVTRGEAVYVEDNKTLTEKLDELSANTSENLPIASKANFGIVKIGSGINVNSDGVISASQGSGGTSDQYKGLLSDFVNMDNNSYISVYLESGIYRVLETNKPLVLNPPFNEDFVLVHQKLFTTSNWALQTAYPINNPSKIWVRRVLCGATHTDSRQGGWRYVGEDSKVNFLKSKKILTMGDSITAKWEGVGDINGIQPYMIERLGLQVSSVAYGGAKISRILNHEPWDSQSFHALATTLDFTPYDIVTVAYGTNDAGHHKAIGEIDSIDPYTFMGALNVGIDAIYESNPNVQLFFCTPIFRNDLFSNDIEQNIAHVKKYGDAIKTVCEKYGIPVFDGLTDCGINRYNYPSSLSNDKLHCTEFGYWLLGARFTEWLGKYI